MLSKLNFYNTISMLQDYSWLNVTYINNGYINVINSIKRDIGLKTQNRQKALKYREAQETNFPKY